MKNKTAEELEKLAYKDFTFDGKTLPPNQTTPYGFRKFFKAYKKGYNRATTQTNEILEAIEDVRELIEEKAKVNYCYNDDKKDAYYECEELLDELLTKFKNK